MKGPKSAAVFFEQIIVIYIVVITSIVNLSVQDCNCPKLGVCNLWIAMLSSAVGYLLPNPSMGINRINNSEQPANTTITSGIFTGINGMDGQTAQTTIAVSAEATNTRFNVKARTSGDIVKNQ